MKFEVDQAIKTFFKKYEDLVFRTTDNGLPDGVSKKNSFSFILCKIDYIYRNSFNSTFLLQIYILFKVIFY